MSLFRLRPPSRRPVRRAALALAFAAGALLLIASPALSAATRPERSSGSYRAAEVRAAVPVISDGQLKARLEEACAAREPGPPTESIGANGIPQGASPTLWGHPFDQTAKDYAGVLAEDVARQGRLLSALQGIASARRPADVVSGLLMALVGDQQRVIEAETSFRQAVAALAPGTNLQLGVSPPTVARSFGLFRDAQVTEDTHFLLAGVLRCAAAHVSLAQGPGQDEASGATQFFRVTAACRNVEVTTYFMRDVRTAAELDANTHRGSLSSGEAVYGATAAGDDTLPFTGAVPGGALRGDDIAVFMNDYGGLRASPSCVDTELAPHVVELAASQLTLRVPTPPAAASPRPGGHMVVLGWRLPAPESFTDPEKLAVAAVATLVGLLFVGFPAELVNKTIEENRERLRIRVPRVLRKVPLPTWLTPVSAVLLFAVVSLVAALASPGSSASQGAAVTAGVLFVALCLTTAAYLGPTEAFARLLAKRAAREAHLIVVPAGLGLAAVCLAVSLFLRWNPTYVYGLVLTFAAAQALLGVLQADEEQASARPETAPRPTDG
jgi:hypothetical protein